MHRLALTLLISAAFSLDSAPGAAQILRSGASGTADVDLTPEQEQRLLGEYWNIAKRYKLDPAKTVGEFSAWTRDRLGKVQSIQFQPPRPLPEYIKDEAEWAPATLRLAAMLHSDLAIAAYQKHNVPEFEFQLGLADGWFVLADNKLSAPGSLRSRWTVTVARMLLVGGDAGIAERILVRASERIGDDAAILLALGTVKETQAGRITAGMSGGKLADPALAAKPRDAALAAAQDAFERAITIQPALVEARVRLAHVFAMKGDDANAFSVVTAVLVGKPSHWMKYLASLIAGGVLERSRQFELAARSYVEAARAMPDGQSAYLALANMFFRSGLPAETGVVMDRFFAGGMVGISADPWSTYALGLDLSMDRQFEEYRNLVRK